jgi:hypothetical protein
MITPAGTQARQLHQFERGLSFSENNHFRNDENIAVVINFYHPG